MVTRKELARRSFVERGVEFPTAEKLSGVVETTALRRGRTESLESIFNPYNPMPEPPNQPAPPPISMPIPPPQNIFAPPPPPPQVQQPQQPDLFANIFAPPPPPPPPPVCGGKKPYRQDGDQIFCTEADYLQTQPCGGKKPYAQNQSTGQLYCTEADFSKYFKLPSYQQPVEKKCPTGQYLDTRRGTIPRNQAKCRTQLFDASGKYLW